jgi:ATP-binding cassette, subfamily B, bacterial MsbA
MKNFLRALRYCWPHRRRLVLSIICAVFAAALWGLNLTAIYPLLKILGPSGENLQSWVDGRIAESDKETTDLQAEEDGLKKRQEANEARPDSELKFKERRDIDSRLARVRGRLASATTALARYEIAKKYIDRFVPEDAFQTLGWLVGLVILAVAIKGVFEFFQESLVGSVVNRSLFDLRNRCYRNVIHLDVDSFGDHGTSEAMSRFTNDTELLGTGLKTLFGKLIAEPLRALSCIVIALWINWQLTLGFLVLVPLAAVILTKVGSLMKRATRRLLERMSSIYKILQESFQGIRLVKAFTMESYERRRFKVATRDYYRKSMLVVNIDAAASPIIEFLGVSAVVIALLAGAYLVLRKETDLWVFKMCDRPLESETLLQLYVLLAAIADPVRKLSSVYTRLQSGAAAADRIFHLADRQPHVRLNSDGPLLARHHATIEFRDVCFSYDPNKPLLTNIGLTIRHGEVIAIVGKNGSGKTTLVGLIPRFYDPDHGSIIIDGLDIRTVNLRSLRRQISLFTQKTVLFDDTVYNNIVYGNRRAKKEEVEAAARQAFAHDFIGNLPRGYETPVGEGGSRLSLGQQQRVALARTILRNPSILILDEFTSAADPESEVLIHRALREFMRGRTTIVITHRLNTLEIADRIIVLDNGRIASMGTHKELLVTCPAYQRLHEAQFQRLVA